MMRTACLLFLAAVALVAQSASDGMSDYMAASREKDSVKKAAALEQWMDKYPKSRLTTVARREVLALRYAENPAAAEKWVKAKGKALPAADRAQLLHDYASLLVDKKSDLKAAGKYVSTAVKTYEAATPKPDSYDSTMRRMRMTAAQIHLARNQDGKARAIFEGVLKKDPGFGDAAQGLADLARKRGDTTAALRYQAQAFLARPGAERRAKLEALYGKKAGLEEYLDGEYQRLFPAAHVAAYRPTQNRSKRVVLAEVYTGAGCGPCVAADVAFDSVLERYRREDVVVVMYHEHIPRPDPLTNSATLDRWKFQQGRGVPTYGLDGEMMNRGGGGRSAAPEIEKMLREAVDQRLETGPLAELSVSATHDAAALRVRVRAGGIETADAKLNLLLVEKQVRYSGENGIRFHPMVVRAIAQYDLVDRAFEREHLFSREAVQSELKKHLDDFEKHDERHNKDGKFRFLARPETIDWNNVAVVAFVQDPKSRKVLQAAWAQPAGAAGQGVPSAE